MNLEYRVQLQRVLAPTLAGHGFQQAALVAMLPVVAERTGLMESQLGMAVSLGMVVTVVMLPVLGRRGGLLKLRVALTGSILATLALVLLIAVAPRDVDALVVFAAVLAIRIVQGLSSAIVLAMAQQASMGAARPLDHLARTQFLASLGRASGTALIAPLLWISAVLPLVPAAVGAGVSLRRSFAGVAFTPQPQATLRVDAGFLITPVLLQTGLGAAQIGLAPMIRADMALTPGEAAAIAGFCLAAANLGMLATHRWITPRATETLFRASPFVIALSIALMPLAASHAVALIVLCAIAGGSTGLLLAMNLSRSMAAQPGRSGSAAAWNAAAQIGGLALGVGAGSALMAVSPAAPFHAGAIACLPVALGLTSSHRIKK